MSESVREKFLSRHHQAEEAGLVDGDLIDRLREDGDQDGDEHDERSETGRETD